MSSASRAVRLTLIRHGESIWNQYSVVQGQSLLAPGLTDRGRREAVPAAEWRERSLGAMEGLPSEKVESRLLGIAGGVVIDPDACPPGGETVRQLFARVGEALNCLADQPPAPHVLVVSHGGTGTEVSR